MNGPANDDLLPEHTDIDTFLAAIRRAHIQRVGEVLDLDAGLAAILTPGASASHENPAVAADSARPDRSPARATFLGGRVAVVILAARSSARDLAIALDSARDLAIALDSDSALALARDLARDSALALARDLARARDLALDSARDLARDLARALDSARDLARAIDRALARARDSARAIDSARDLARDLARALARAAELRGQLDAVEVDASGADLSALELTDMSALTGVVWTDETIWASTVDGQVRSWSREIRPGVYQVQGGSERNPYELVIT